MTYKPLPIGVDNFEEIITKEYYYVDKTLFIEELLDKMGKVNLFTRPRRFGKTLNLSMLQYFFEIPQNGRSNKGLFAGLNIMDCGEKYTSQQEQYPVIFLTLKSAKQPDYKMAYESLVDDIAREYNRHSYVLQSDHITEADKEKFIAVRDRKGDSIDYAKSLLFLSMCLWQCHGKRTIILIDEYDVPLENAYYTGFYEKMVTFIRSLFESALKTNPYLEFSVITGCLRNSRESIFTGLNNLNIISILNSNYGEYFGFTETEVRAMLEFYQRESHMETMKQWYDGYLFGETEVYNPWSVINFTEDLNSRESAFPTAKWSNTSSNSIVKDLIYRSGDEGRDEIERLMAGGTIEKTVHEDITYDTIYETEDNLWNLLFFTGYLKMTGMRMEGINRLITMAIPNLELLYVYENTVAKWFRDEIKQQDLSGLYQKLLEGRAEEVQEQLETQLQATISYMDNKEAFYHGFLIGLLSQLKGYITKSNREAGLGRYDICIYSHNIRKPVVLIELKLADTFQELEAASDRALAQLHERKYYLELAKEGYQQVICYGIGFYKKQIGVKAETVAL